MAATPRLWPADISAYRRTPDFTEATVPAGLLRSHSTKAGVWAKLHVLEGRLLFRDLVDHTETLLDPGIYPLIHPQALHEVAPQGAVRFFVEFHARPAD